MWHLQQTMLTKHSFSEQMSRCKSNVLLLNTTIEETKLGYNYNKYH